MSIFRESWFWMAVVGLIAIIFGIIVYSFARDSINGVPWWAYVLIALGFILLIMSVIISSNNYYFNKLIFKN
jgi:uncharacterized membrane protein HdeD (DUF308 family)